jgi:hypothetical protein
MRARPRRSALGSRPRTIRRVAFLGLALLALGTADAGAADFPVYDGTIERDAFWEFQNKRVLERLQATEKDLAEKTASETDETLKTALAGELEKVRLHLQKPELFTFAGPADLPTKRPAARGQVAPSAWIHCPAC